MKSRQCRLQGFIKGQQFASDLLSNFTLIISIMDFEINLKKIDQRKIRSRLAVRDRARFDDQPSLRPMRMDELVEQSRLSQTRLSNYRNNLTMSAAGSVQGRAKLLDIF